MAAPDFKAFYRSAVGRVVRQIILQSIDNFARHVRDSDLALGLGYSAPYTPSGWLNLCGHLNATEQSGCIADTAQLPLPHDSVMRAVVIHDLEFAGDVRQHLQELYRVLAPQAEAVVIVPNRLSRWTQAAWSPLAHGMPFSRGQILHYLQQPGFEILHAREALFLPPLRQQLVLRFASALDRIFGTFSPFWGGVHVIHVRKTIPAPVGKMLAEKKPFWRVLFSEPAS